MGQRKKRVRPLRWIVPLLIVVVFIEVAYSLHGGLPEALKVAFNPDANLAQAATSITCGSGQLFIFSDDFASANTQNTNRPIKLISTQCPVGIGLPMNFIKSKVLYPKDACVAYPVQQGTCAEVLYAVVPGSSGKTPTDGELNDSFFTFDTRLCGRVRAGGIVKATDCNAAMTALRSKYPQLKQVPTSGAKTQTIPTPYNSANNTFAQNFQNGLMTGNIVIAPNRGLDMTNSGAYSGEAGMLGPNQGRTFGIGITFKINP